MKRLRVEVRGVVQGVGFRPFVYRTAHACTLTGWVRNAGDGVRIEIQGTASGLDRFLSALRDDRPAAAVLTAVEVEEVAPEPQDASFEIRVSTGGAAPVPADLATCPRCLEEVRAPGERRFAYPFTNCTDCGPRYSIIERVPYDRPHTSMRRFPMCEACQAEYTDPLDRRFHAQPIACPRCGPRLTLLGATGEARPPLHHADGDASSPFALQNAAGALLEGEIVALHGVGGFQLLVDATNEAAVQRLRARKQRGDKPFAVLVASVEVARHLCHVDATEAATLTSPAAPIVLLRRRGRIDEGGGEVSKRLDNVAKGVAPGVGDLGLMLPCSPLHHLLVALVDRPLVCTSGNRSEEPICTDPAEAMNRLGGVADLFLVHDRPVVRPLDDSVVRVVDGSPRLLRRARGYVPLPIGLRHKLPSVLALGGHLKCTVAICRGTEAIVSQHLGDLESVETRDLLERSVDDLLAFFDARPRAIACDLHPDYASTHLAEKMARERGLPVIRVQHHHAHVAACMAEHGLDGEVAGFAWDGVGLGTDDGIWGGELLVCSATRFERAGSLHPFPLIGGDRAAREPRRAALGLLSALRGEVGLEVTLREGAAHLAATFTEAEMSIMRGMLERRVNTPSTTSMGRLFDGVAALLGLTPVASFEGQAAMGLEALADADGTDGAYPMPWNGDTLDWRPTIEAILDDRTTGVARSRISARFHAALADAVVAGARRLSLPRVVLSGGCFQNRRLLESTARGLRAAGFEVFTPRVVPPNDGGISLGQLWVAAHALGEP